MTRKLRWKKKQSRRKETFFHYQSCNRLEIPAKRSSELQRIQNHQRMQKQPWQLLKEKRI